MTASIVSSCAANMLTRSLPRFRSWLAQGRRRYRLSVHVLPNNYYHLHRHNFTQLRCRTDNNDNWSRGYFKPNFETSLRSHSTSTQLHSITSKSHLEVQSRGSTSTYHFETSSRDTTRSSYLPFLQPWTHLYLGPNDAPIYMRASYFSSLELHQIQLRFITRLLSCLAALSNLAASICGLTVAKTGYFIVNPADSLHKVWQPATPLHQSAEGNAFNRLT
jgi:hypothetical protein